MATNVTNFEKNSYFLTGHKPEEDCSILYPPPGKENICHILPWQSDKMMSLNFDHTELWRKNTSDIFSAFFNEIDKPILFEFVCSNGIYSSLS